MSKVNQIQNRIKELNGGQFQSLCDSYLSKRFGVKISSFGSQDGTNKTLPGTPDAYFVDSDEKYIFIEHTTEESNILNKILNDIRQCLNPDITGVSISNIKKIIYCHTKRISVGQHSEITKLCVEKGCLFENFDISQLSRELAYYYQDVAKEELGIELDSDQIISPERFISIESETISLKNKFFYREKEKELVLTAITNNDVVILTGAAGVGKTRLGVECLQDFQKSNPDFSIYCIKNRSLSLFEDFKLRKTESKKLLFLIDDANRIISLTTILSYINENNSENQLKLILTVRNYALELVTQKIVDSHVKFEKIEIEAFDPTEIEEIISSESFNIKNTNFISRICTVSQGNARLAVMAAKVVQKSKKLEDLKDVSKIYDRYFSEVKEMVFSKEDDASEKVLAIVAYFYSISKENPPTGIYENFGIPEIKFWEKIYLLDEYELIDLYEDSIGKISDQVLGTYFLFRALFVKKNLDFKVLLIEYFQINIERMRETIYPIINSFDGETIINFIKPSILELTEEFNKTGEISKNKNLLNVFYFVIPDKVLLFIDNYIDSLCPDIDEFVFDTNNHGLTNEIFLLLKRVGDLGDDYLQLSIQLAIKYALKCNSIAHQFGQYIVSGFDFDRNNIDRSIYKQIILFETLIKKSKKNDLIKESIIFSIPHFLQIQHHHSQSYGMKISFSNYGLIFSENLKKLRMIIFSFLGTLEVFKFLDCLQKYVNNSFFHYDFSEEEIKKAINFDSNYLLPMIDEKIPFLTIFESKVVFKYLIRLSDYEIKNDLIEIIKKKLLTDNYKLYCVLSSNNFDRIETEHEGLSFDEKNRMNQLEQREVVHVLSSVEFESFFDYLKLELERNDPDDIWDISNIINNLFESLDNDIDLFYKILAKVLTFEEKIVKNLQSIPSILFRKFPEHHKKFYNQIVKTDFKGKTHFKYNFLISLPSELIDDFYIEKIILLFSNEFFGTYISFDNFIKFENYREGLFLNFIRTIYNNRKLNKISFELLFFPYSEISKNYLEILFIDEKLIQDIWLYEMNNNQNIDSDGEFFNRFIINTPDFIICYLDTLFTHKEEDHPNEFTKHPNFTHIWSLENHFQIMERIISFISNNEKYSSQYSFLKTFFIVKNIKGGLTIENIRERQEEFIKQFIKKNHNDLKLMELIFVPIKCYFFEKMPDFTIQLLQQEDNDKVFKNITFDPTSFSGNGSFVPAYEKAMEFWKKLKEKLDSSEFLSARLFVSEQIDYWKRKILKEQERNFSTKY